MTPNRVKLGRAITFMKSLIGEKKEKKNRKKNGANISYFFPE